MPLSFSFKVTGSVYFLALAIAEIKLKAHEESFGPGDLEIIDEHLLDQAPYIIVTCKDPEKGKKLYDRVQGEAPRFKRQ